MNWKEELDKIEENQDWKSAASLMDDLINTNQDELEVYERIIFLLLDLLVEGRYTEIEHSECAKKIKQYFDLSQQKFSDDAEYLFFTGIMIFIAEWYFGFDDTAVAEDMLRKAKNLQPDNVLFKWGYYSRVDQRSEINKKLKIELSEQLLFKETSKLEWLRSKGLLGKYVLGTLESSYEALKRM